jgi:hypothetical protein
MSTKLKAFLVSSSIARTAIDDRRWAPPQATHQNTSGKVVARCRNSRGSTACSHPLTSADSGQCKALSSFGGGKLNSGRMLPPAPFEFR